MNKTFAINNLRLKPGPHFIAPITDLDTRERVIAIITIAAACQRYGIPVLVACACSSTEIFFRRALGDSAVFTALASNNVSWLRRCVDYLEIATAVGAVVLIDGKTFQIKQFQNLISVGGFPGVTNSSLSIVVPVLADNVSLENTARVLELFPQTQIVFQALHPTESWAWSGYGVWHWPQRENRPVWDFHKIPMNFERFIIRGGDEAVLPPVAELAQFLTDNIDNLEEIDAIGIEGAINYLESSFEPIYRHLLADITEPFSDTHESQPSESFDFGSQHRGFSPEPINNMKASELEMDDWQILESKVENIRETLPGELWP
jgi:hypothetical protein